MVRVMSDQKSKAVALRREETHLKHQRKSLELDTVKHRREMKLVRQESVQGDHPISPSGDGRRSLGEDPQL